MKIEFTGRNFTVSPAIRKHITEHFKKVEEFLNGTDKVHVILSIEKHHRHVAEVVVNWQHRSLTAQADTTDMYTSSSQAIDKLRRQIVKLKGKIVDSKHTAPSVKAVAPSPVPPVVPERPAPRVIRSRRYAVKPMTPEEAMIQVEATTDQFLVFRDAETNRVGVLYKRKDGNYGLIEP
jgi:putative sigma-54 modulation protein